MKHPLVPVIAALWLASSSLAAVPQHGGERALLVVDPMSPDALHVANVYAAARRIPSSNVLFMDPDATSYQELVAAPMQGMLGEIEQRGLGASADFVILAPSDQYRTTASGLVDDMCVAVGHFGLAACYGLYSYADLILGTASLSAPAIVNPFVGSNWRGRSFRGADYWRGGSVVAAGSSNSHRMLIPARLGWTGDRGNTRAEVLDLVTRSVAADGTFPTGTVYYMQTTDAARSGPRHDLYPTAVTRLASAGGAGEHLFDVLPTGRHDALGIMTGAATPDIDGADLTLLGGSFTDHLTSFAGHFDTASQTKMSRWIAKGASATSGAVEEPCNYAVKFPHPRVHTAYRRGVTLGEAWYRSRGAVPLQSMFLGDPLTQPWPMGPTVSVAGIPTGPAAGALTITPSAVPNSTTGTPVAAHELFIDGVLVDRVSDGSSFSLDTSALASGPHDILVRSEDDSAVRLVGVWSGELEVASHPGAVTCVPSAAAIDLDGTVDLTLSTSGGIAEEIVVRHLGRVVASVAGGSGTVTLSGRQLGSGPVRLTAEAVFLGAVRAISGPVWVDVSELESGASPTSPVAYGYRRELKDDAPFVLDLPATITGALEDATFELVTPPARSTVLGTSFGALILEPAPGARGVDLAQFRVTTPAGSSEVATVQIVYPAAAPLDPTLFCRTAPNDAGPGARMGWDGSPSLAAQDLVLSAAGLPSQSFGIIFRGQGFNQLPVGNGWLCAAGGQVRLAVLQADTAGLLQWTVQPLGQTPTTAGSTWGFQLWHRDVGGAGFGFSDGVAVTFTP